MKKRVLLIILVCCGLTFAQTSLPDLWVLALENNYDIKSAELAFNNANILSKNANGSFCPSVSLSTNGVVSNDYDFTAAPDQFSSSITYNQPIPGGTSFSISSSYGYAITDINEERYITQSPSITFGVTQSLCPFFLQGTLKEPVINYYNKQKEYQYNQYLYTEKNVIQNLTQYYIYSLIYSKKAEIYKNYIDITNQKIQSLRILQKNGEIDYTQINELENSKISYMTEYISLKSTVEQYKQNMKEICKSDVNTLQDDVHLINYGDFLNKYITLDKDCFEQGLDSKIDIAKNQKVLSRQSNAPTLTFSIKPSWASDLSKIEEWKDFWSDKNKVDNWNVSLAVNISPLLNYVFTSTNKQNNFAIQSAKYSKESYLNQREYTKLQYQNILDSYKQQKLFLESVCFDQSDNKELLDLQFNKGQISELDYLTSAMQIQNNKLSLECVNLYIWLYEFLLYLL